MTTESVNARTADADRFLPADGLSLLGEHQGKGYTGRRFLVRRSDGQVIQLPLLLYLIMAAVAEGGVDGGWSADQVGTRVGAASGQGLTADNVRYLIAGKLVPLGLVAAGHGTGRLDRAPGAAQPPRPHRRRWVLALGGAAAAVSVAAAAPIMTRTGNQEAGRTVTAAAVTASWSQAAVWVAQQVSPDVTVWCDPGMCGQLRRDGFPAARLKALTIRARALPGSGVVVATAAVRGQLGPRLAAAYASQVIASFGSGAARVDVRTIAPSGATAFKTQLAAEETALTSVGRQLLSNTNIQVSPSARAALRAGQVDARLLTVLSLLSAQLPVQLVRFTGAPGAGPGVPLRGAEIGVTSPAARSAVVALLNAQQSPYRPTVAAAADGSRPLVALRFDAPASLDISSP